MRLWRADQVEVTVLPQDSSSFVLCVEHPLCSFVFHAAAPPPSPSRCWLRLAPAAAGLMLSSSSSRRSRRWGLVHSCCSRQAVSHTRPWNNGRHGVFSRSFGDAVQTQPAVAAQETGFLQGLRRWTGM